MDGPNPLIRQAIKTLQKEIQEKQSLLSALLAADAVSQGEVAPVDPLALVSEQMSRADQVRSVLDSVPERFTFKDVEKVLAARGSALSGERLSLAVIGLKNRGELLLVRPGRSNVPAIYERAKQSTNGTH